MFSSCCPANVGSASGVVVSPRLIPFALLVGEVGAWLYAQDTWVDLWGLLVLGLPMFK